MSESSPVNSGPDSPDHNLKRKTPDSLSSLDEASVTIVSLNREPQLALAAAARAASFPRVPLSAAAAAQVVAANAAAAAAMAANRLQAAAAASTSKKDSPPPTIANGNPNSNLLQLQLVNENGSITPIEVVTSMAAAIVQQQQQAKQQQQLEAVDMADAGSSSENDEVSQCTMRIIRIFLDRHDFIAELLVKCGRGI